MNISNRILVYLLILVVIFNGCGPAQLPDDSLKNVPADISAVTAFNVSQLMQKADMDYIRSLDFYKDAINQSKQDDVIISKFLEDPNSTGIDLQKNMYMIYDIDKESPNEEFIGFVCSVKDQSVFETMITDIDLGTIQNGTGYNFVSKQRKLVAWNQDFAIIGNASKHFDMSNQANRFFNIEPSNSIAENNDLKKCLSKDFDIAIWMGSNALAKNEQIRTAANLLSISHSALENNYIHSYLNFEEGEIVGHAKNFFQKELTNDLNLFFKKGIKKDLSKYIPADNLGMMVSMAMDSKGIYQVISEKAGGYALANKSLKQYGFNSKDIANAFGGDAMVAIYPDQTDKDGLLVSTINDHEIFEKFIDLAKQYEVLEKQADNLYLIKNAGFKSNLAADQNAWLLIKDDLFFVSSKSDILQTINNGGYKGADKVPDNIYDALGTNAMGSYVNFESLKQLKTDWQKLPFKDAQMNAGLKKSEMKIEMMDKDMNSLKSMFKMLNEIYLEKEMQKETESI